MSSHYGNRIVVDTGPLLVHAAGVFDKGRTSKPHLKKATSNLRITEDDAEHFSEVLDRVFSSAREIIITPYVLAELCNLASHRLKLKNERLEEFISSYKEFLLKLRECNVAKKDIIDFKDSWKFCFTDASLALISRRKGMTLITTDFILANWCKKHNIDARDAYNDIYLSAPRP